LLTNAGCEPLRLFSSFASADQYKTVSSPLGPDPKVGAFRVCRGQTLTHRQDASLFLPIYSSRLPGPLCIPSLLAISLTSSPGWLRGFLAWLAGSVLGDTQFASLVRSARLKSVREYYAVIEERNAFARRFCDEVRGPRARIHERR
jgi:hypothetical protein